MANSFRISQSTNLSGYDYRQDNIRMLALTLIGVNIASSLGEGIVYRAYLINRVSQLTSNKKVGHVFAVILSFGY